MSFEDHSSVRRMSSLEGKPLVDSQTNEDKQSINNFVNNPKKHKESLESIQEKKRLPLHPNSDNSLFSTKAIRCVVFWYFFSFTTLFLNKYIVSYERGDTTMLAVFQLMSCAVCSGAQLRYWPTIKRLFSSSSETSDKKFVINGSNFTKNLIVVGCLRYSTILLGLIALWFVEVSFAETVKSSAPVFTVIITRFVLGERTTLLVNLSLIPVMVGLALCSAFEMSFTLIGFMSTLATNLSECLQNVFSKKLLTVEHYSAAELQFYTSVSSFMVQIPCLLILVNFRQFWHSIQTEDNLLLTYVLCGISFHCQSYTEYILLSLISPVTHSVANTAKRAFLIWLSVIIFGNPVTTLSWIGTAFVISGVLLYNRARELTIINKSNSGLNYSVLESSETHDV